MQYIFGIISMFCMAFSLNETFHMLTSKLLTDFYETNAKNYRHSLRYIDKTIEGPIPSDTSQDFVSLKGHIKLEVWISLL